MKGNKLLTQVNYCVSKIPFSFTLLKGVLIAAI